MKMCYLSRLNINLFRGLDVEAHREVLLVLVPLELLGHDLLVSCWFLSEDISTKQDRMVKYSATTMRLRTWVKKLCWSWPSSSVTDVKVRRVVALHVLGNRV